MAMTPEQLEEAIHRIGELAESMRKSQPGAGTLGSSTSRLNTADTERFQKDLSKFTEQLKESSQRVQTLAAVVKGTMPNFQSLDQDIEQLTEKINDFDKAIEETTKAIDQATDTKTKENLETKKRNQIQAKEEAQKAIETAKSSQSLNRWGIGIAGATAVASKFVMGMIKSEMVLFDTAMSVSAGLLAGKATNDLYTESVVGNIKAANELKRGFNDATTTLGEIITVLSAFIPGGALVKVGIAALGGALVTGSKLAQQYNDRQADIQTKATENLNSLFNDTREGFRTILKAGGNLAQGMTELNDLTIEAGMRSVKQFAEGLAESRESIQRTGMSFNEAASLLAKVSKNIRGPANQLGLALDHLGYSVQEQVGLMADVMANLSRAGDARAKDEKYVAQQTLEYGKNLRVLQEITEGDVREKLREAQKEMAEPVLQAQAQAEGPGGFERISGLLETLNQVGGEAASAIKMGLKAGTVVAGGGGIASLYQNSPEFRKMYDQLEALRHDKTITNQAVASLRASSIITEYNSAMAVKQMDKGYEQMKFFASQNNDVLKQQLGIQTQFGLYAQRVTKEKISGAKSAVEKEANGEGRIDRPYATATEVIEREGNIFLSEMQGPLASFVQKMGDAATVAAQFADSLSKVKEYLYGKPAETPKNYAEEERKQGIKQGTAAMPKDFRQSVPARPDEKINWKGAAAWDSMYGKGWNPDGSSKTGGTPLGTQGGGLTDEAARGISKDPLSLIKFTDRTGDKSHFDNLNAEAKAEFLKMIAEYNKPVTLTSAFRSREEQANLTGTGANPVAEPGRSRHQYGTAIDLDSRDIAGLTSMKGLLERHKFTTIEGDANHLQYEPWKNNVPQMEKGGVVQPTDGGTMVNVAEAGRAELIAPLNQGKVNVNNDDVISVLNNILAVMMDQHYTSTKILRASV
jgi:tetratricopeptide (TPR) repeat protein